MIVLLMTVFANPLEHVGTCPLPACADCDRALQATDDTTKASEVASRLFQQMMRPIQQQKIPPFIENAEMFGLPSHGVPLGAIYVMCTTHVSFDVHCFNLLQSYWDQFNLPQQRKIAWSIIADPAFIGVSEAINLLSPGGAHRIGGFIRNCRNLAKFCEQQAAITLRQRSRLVSPEKALPPEIIQCIIRYFSDTTHPIGPTENRKNSMYAYVVSGAYAWAMMMQNNRMLSETVEGADIEFTPAEVAGMKARRDRRWGRTS